MDEDFLESLLTAILIVILIGIPFRIILELLGIL